MKLQAVKENRGKSGVYRWINQNNGRTYVGSSVNLGKRFTSYYSFKYLTDPKRNMLIHKALLKYGYSNFRDSRVLLFTYFISKRAVLYW